VRQYRLLINRVSWEIPGGKVDEGETPQASAIRECLEETGVFCRSMTPLLSYHPGLDALHNPTYLFYSEDHVKLSGSSHDTQEVVQQEWVPLARCIDMIFAQQIVDSFSIVALFSYQALRDRR
jgi:ADP-ribose pyrophosphatase